MERITLEDVALKGEWELRRIQIERSGEESYVKFISSKCPHHSTYN